MIVKMCLAMRVIEKEGIVITEVTQAKKRKMTNFSSKCV